MVLLSNVLLLFRSDAFPISILLWLWRCCSWWISISVPIKSWLIKVFVILGFRMSTFGLLTMLMIYGVSLLSLKAKASSFSIFSKLPTSWLKAYADCVGLFTTTRRRLPCYLTFSGGRLSLLLLLSDSNISGWVGAEDKGRDCLITSLDSSCRVSFVVWCRLDTVGPSISATSYSYLIYYAYSTTRFTFFIGWNYWDFKNFLVGGVESYFVVWETLT